MKTKKTMVETILFLALLGVLAGSAFCQTLSWDPDPDSTVTGYRLHYGTSPGTFPTTVDLGGTGTEFSLDSLTLESGVTYYFVVSAYNEFGESGFSSSVSWTRGDATPPLPPLGLTAH